jgi:hypothetical protein
LRDWDWDKRDITWSPLQEAHQDHCSDGEDNLFSQSWDASNPEWQTSTFYTLKRGMQKNLPLYWKSYVVLWLACANRNFLRTLFTFICQGDTSVHIFECEVCKKDSLSPAVIMVGSLQTLAACMSWTLWPLDLQMGQGSI